MGPRPLFFFPLALGDPLPRILRKQFSQPAGFLPSAADAPFTKGPAGRLFNDLTSAHPVPRGTQVAGAAVMEAAECSWGFFIHYCSYSHPSLALLRL